MIVDFTLLRQKK